MSFVYVNCTCGQSWSSVLPPPPCPAHGHSSFSWDQWYRSWQIPQIPPSYVGRHRKPDQFYIEQYPTL